jgi:hypothetical protein
MNKKIEDYHSIKESLPQNGVIVMTKIDDEKGIRNEQLLKRKDNLWFKQFENLKAENEGNKEIARARGDAINNLNEIIEQKDKEIAILKAKVNELTMADMTHEYNEAEAEKFRPEHERQLLEPFKEGIERLYSLMPYHINPYNLGEMGEISNIISRLHRLFNKDYKDERSVATEDQSELQKPETKIKTND